ncbi:MAG: PAS domain S-box protein [Deltaproteobacteria bacterium]|nr:PAS domain S-box protein [Deltaproteobacteria bacterium]MDQ3297452.1 ATP-binding protein [Myxococcota bacterium]
MRTATALTVIIFLSTVAAVRADPPSQYPFRRFGVEHGLQNLSLNQISQTGDGLLWVASEDGLYQYDGTRFRRFDVAEGLPSSHVKALLPERRGLWVGTERGVALVVDGQVTTTALTQSLPAELVNALTLGPDGTLWVASDGGLYHERGDRFELAPGWPGGASSAVRVEVDGRVIAGRVRDVISGDGAGSWTVYGESAGFGLERIDAIARTGDNTLWVRSSRYLWECKETLATCRDVSSDLPDASELGRLLVDRHGTLWVTTRRGIAHRLADGTWDVIGAAEGLPARSVLGAFEDREGSMWLIGDELFQMLGRGLWRSYTAAHDFPADTVWSMMRDRRGALWVGTNRGVLEATAESWTVFPGTEPFAFNAVIEVNGAIYAAGSGPDVLRLDSRTRTTTVLGPGAELAGDNFNSMVHEGDTLWVASWKSGLLAMTEGDGKRTWRRESLPRGNDRENVNQLVLDRHGRLWATGTEGLAVRDDRGWHRLDEREGLTARSTQYIVERASGEICVAYSEAHGVTCFRYGTEVTNIRHLTTAHGLASDKVYLLGEDARGRLYVGMGIGVDVIDGGSHEHFSTATGLAGDDCAARAFWSDPDGDVFIGTTRGMARFASARYTAPPLPPEPVILGVSLGGTPLGTGPPRAPKPGSASLYVQFAAPTFGNRAQIELQVRLLPLESEWRMTSVGEARYHQLPPDDYRFEVRSRIAPGAFGPATTVVFSIEPAWWQTLGFRVLVALALVIALLLVIAWRARVSTARAARRIVLRSEASFRALIDQSPDAVIVHREGTVIYANHKALESLGYPTPDEIVGGPALALVHPDDHGAVLARAAMLARGEPLPVRELRFQRKDGSHLVAEVSALTVDFGGTPATLAVLRDCTERKALETRLVLADRMASIGTLAAGIAHEINNPLAYVKGNLAFLAEELPESAVSPALRVALNDAVEGATRVQRIVAGLKTFSRADHEQRASIDVQRALELALRMTSNELRHRCTVTTKLGPVPHVLGDESRLGQVFINLLVNAAHAIPDGRADDHQIHVSTHTDDAGRAVIEIHDDGCGMAPDVVKRIFDPFFTTKDVGEGTGLGLAIGLGIVKALGGEILVDSTPGVGSTFTVTLPPMTPGSEIVSARAPSPAPVLPDLPDSPETSVTARLVPRSSQVLLIDDDDRLRTSLARMLRKEHTITLASSAREALAHLDAGETFDVIVSDLMMPEMTGMELHAALHRRDPELAARMVFMTGGAFTEDAQLFIDQIPHRWLQKPFEVAEIRQLVRRVLARRRADAA